MTDPRQDPEPPTDQVVALGATLTALASSSDDRGCLDMFGEALSVGTEVMGPLLFTVLVEPLAGAQIAMIGHVRPGMTLQVDADLQVRLLRPWFPRSTATNKPGCRRPLGQPLVRGAASRRVRVSRHRFGSTRPGAICRWQRRD